MLKSRLLCAAWIGLLCLLLSLPARAASGAVTDCAVFDDGNLGDGTDTLGELLPGGGTITFACNGTIIVPEIIIADNTVLDAVGRSVTLNGNSANRVIYVVPGITVSLNHLTVRGGQAGMFGGGGGINNEGTATVTNSIITGNQAFNGGGVQNVGTMTITGSIISANAVIDSGGGIHNTGTLTLTNSTVSGNSTDNQGGGGIYSGTTPMTITGSTVSGNRSGADGGGIDNGGPMTLTNSTISGNYALAPGGGLTNVGPLTIINSTFSGNESALFGGNLNINGTLTIRNSIVANSIAGGDCTNPVGVITALGANLVEDNGCGFATLTGDPGLAPLAAIGGQTRTHGLLAGSIALDAAVGCPPPATDQRGVARPGGIACDLGAFEGVVPAQAAAPLVSAVVSLCDTLATRSEGAMTASPSGEGLALRPDSVRGSVYCHIITVEGRYITSPGEIGRMAVITSGVVGAVDVFGLTREGDPIVPFAAPMTICLRGSGDVLFFSAAGAARQPQPLPVVLGAEGYTCAVVPEAGTVVLVNPGTSVGDVGASSAPTPLTTCRVTTLDAPLNLRAEPDITAAVLAKLPLGLTLTTTERAPGWYRVIYLDIQGWLSADFVSVSADCG